jgi:hypothetical protein
MAKMGKNGSVWRTDRYSVPDETATKKTNAEKIVSLS